MSNAKDQREASNNAIQQQIDSLKDSLAYRASLGSTPAQSTQSQEIAIQKMQNTLEDAAVTAPVSGVVTAVYAKVGEPGNGLLFVVEDTQSLKINTKIKEYDVANIREGMSVVIKSDATGDQEISGTVTYIAPAAVKTEAGNTQTGGNDSNVEYRSRGAGATTIADCGLRTRYEHPFGRACWKEKQDVFGVPYDAVVRKGGRLHCGLCGGRAAEQRQKQLLCSDRDSGDHRTGDRFLYRNFRRRSDPGHGK